MSDRKSKVSVIVPVYNVENYLKRCVDSLIRQSLAEIEILLIDDGSTDRSGELCDKLAGADLRISVYHKENEGQGIARNLGLQKLQERMWFFWIRMIIMIRTPAGIFLSLWSIHRQTCAAMDTR